MFENKILKCSAFHNALKYKGRTYFGLLNSKIDKRTSTPFTRDESALMLSRSDRIVSMSVDRISSLKVNIKNIFLNIKDRYNLKSGYTKFFNKKLRLELSTKVS